MYINRLWMKNVHFIVYMLSAITQRLTMPRKKRVEQVERLVAEIPVHTKRKVKLYSKKHKISINKMVDRGVTAYMDNLDLLD